MIKRSQDYVEIHGKIIYKAETTTGWAVVIMPDGILIDNYHYGYTHIHSNPDIHNFKEKIKDNSHDKVYRIICSHIEMNECLNLKTLIEELKK